MITVAFCLVFASLAVNAGLIVVAVRRSNATVRRARLAAAERAEARASWAADMAAVKAAGDRAELVVRAAQLARGPRSRATGPRHLAPFAYAVLSAVAA